MKSGKIGKQEIRKSGKQENRKSGNPEIRKSGNQEIRKTGNCTGNREISAHAFEWRASKFRLWAEFWALERTPIKSRGCN
jgi:hypothetical protein